MKQAKKVLMSLALIIGICIPQNVLAQEKEFTTPEKSGYTLTRSTTIDGMKCDHFEKGASEVRTFRKDNGDFMTFKEDPDGLNNPPKDDDSSIGDFQYTFKDGIIVLRKNDEAFVKMPNGNTIVMVRYGHYYDEIKKVTKTFQQYFDEFFHNRFKGIYLKNQPDTLYSCGENRVINIGNRNYRIGATGDIVAIAMKVPIEGTDEISTEWASSIDSIISVEKTADGRIVKYANGDVVTIDKEDVLVNGSVIHRKNGVLKIKNNKQNYTMKDGSIFVGWFKEQYRNNALEMTMYSNVLQYAQLTPWYGTYQTPDGNVKNISQGIGGIDYAEKAKSEIEGKKKQIAQARATYTKKYGATNSNYLSKQGIVAKGMSIAFIREYINDFNQIGIPSMGTNVRLTLKEYKPTERDMMQYGRTVKSYKLFSNGLAWGDGAIWSFLVLNGKVVSSSKLSVGYEGISMERDWNDK